MMILLKKTNRFFKLKYENKSIKRAYSDYNNNNNSDIKKTSLYIHWPFCKSICPYCDFNRYLVKNENDQTYLNKEMYPLLMTELRHSLSQYSSNNFILNHNNQQIGSIPNEKEFPNILITSIFFGGGTPSLADPDFVYNIVSYIKNHCLTNDNLEITIESNPTSFELQKMKHFRDSGVNRLSLGVQSLYNDDLIFLGRNHNRDDAIKSIEIANSLFDKTSFDLIYSRHPQQTPGLWENELNEALKLGTKHLSLYSLTIEPGTSFYQRVKSGKMSLVDPDHDALLYSTTVNFMEKNKFNQYEISNFAIDGYECHHNLNYWRFGDYIGIGPGAASRMTFNDKKVSTMRIKVPEKWIESVNQYHNGTDTKMTSVLDENEMLMELLMVGLRIKDGISLESIKRYIKKNSFEECLPKDKLKMLIKEGFLFIEDDKLKPTPKGFQYHNSVIKTLI